MNRTCRQVWQRALSALQVASEASRPRDGAAFGTDASMVHRHPLALACAALALGAFALPAWSAPMCAAGSTAIGDTTGNAGTSGAPGITGDSGDAGLGSVSGTVCVGAGIGVKGGMGGTGGNGADAKGAVGVGGSATPPGNGGVGGTGGAGVTGFAAGTVVVNDGALSGGNGGTGGNGGDGFVGGSPGTGGAGGHGGAGVSGYAFALINAGSITGGDAGAAGADGGTLNGGCGPHGCVIVDPDGGVGVVSTGASSLTTSGNIAGGIGMNAQGQPTQADVVDLSGGGNILTLESGYVFTGNVVSTSGTAAAANVATGASQNGDTLALGGTTNASFDLGQVGTEYQGFNNFAKTGDSTWTVTGSNASAPFQGAITVDAGTLQVGDGSTATTLSGGSVNVANGATLSGFGTVDPTLTTIAAGGSLSPGAGSAIGSLAFDGDLDLLGTANFAIDGTGSGDFDLLNVLGNATFGTTSFFNFALGGDGNQAAGDSFQFFNANEFLNFADVGSNFACSGLTAGLTCGLSQAGDYLMLTLNGSSGTGSGGTGTGGNGGGADVPEPSGLGMLGLGLAFLGGLVVFDRRRRVQSASGVRGR